MINTNNVLHGFTDLKNLDSLGPIVLNQAKGIYVYDQDGKKYLDANSGLWNSVVGFDHPRMIETAKNNMKNFPATMLFLEGFLNPPFN
jgi:4-aminobutyrate--pyruvate transaminase